MCENINFSFLELTNIKRIIMKLRKNSSWIVFPLLFLIRITSIFFIQTFYEADEYWQSLEVAHRLVYGYGSLTWEWQKGIRSYIHPLIFSSIYKILQVFDADKCFLIVYLPRFFQALLSAYSDFCFYNWCGHKKWAVFTLSSSWFYYYMGSRTLINSFETSITTIALSWFPWPGYVADESVHFLWLVAFNCIIRPTAAIMWFPLCVYHLAFTKHSRIFLVLTKYLPIGVLALMLSIVIDSLAHGSFIITFYEFFKFNVLQGGSSFYGVQPWYWYMSSGLPAVLGVHLMPFLLAAVVVLKYRKIHPNELIMLWTIVFTVGLLSFLPHKEFRFLMPVLPLIFFVTSRYLSAWSQKAREIHIWIVAMVILIGNLVPVYYLGMVHQRGTLDVMSHLREIVHKNPNETSFLFLMPCHSTPMYSHLHVNVTTRYLTCLPNLNQSANYVDEATRFYIDPTYWLRQNYPPNGSLPSHIITFDNLVPRLSDILSRYKTVVDIFHTNIPVSNRVGNRVMVHEIMF